MVKSGRPRHYLSSGIRRIFLLLMVKTGFFREIYVPRAWTLVTSQAQMPLTIGNHWPESEWCFGAYQCPSGPPFLNGMSRILDLSFYSTVGVARARRKMCNMTYWFILQKGTCKCLGIVYSGWSKVAIGPKPVKYSLCKGNSPISLIMRETTLMRNYSHEPA